MKDRLSHPDVVTLRPFVPGTSFEAGLRFCTDLGLTIRPITEALASIELGPFRVSYVVDPSGVLWYFAQNPD